MRIIWFVDLVVPKYIEFNKMLVPKYIEFNKTFKVCRRNFRSGVRILQPSLLLCLLCNQTPQLACYVLGQSVSRYVCTNEVYLFTNWEKLYTRPHSLLNTLIIELICLTIYALIFVTPDDDRQINVTDITIVPNKNRTQICS